MNGLSRHVDVTMKRVWIVPLEALDIREAQRNPQLLIVK
jgi:hypothetical protein